MKLTFTLIIMLFISCEAQKPTNSTDYSKLTEITILADTVGTGDSIKFGDRVRFNFRTWDVFPELVMKRETFSAEQDAILDIGTPRFPAPIQKHMMEMLVGGKRTVFFPADSATGRPAAIVDLSIEGIIPPVNLWDLGEFTYKTTKSGLKCHVVDEGNGTKVAHGDSILVHYSGYLKSTGERFDSSVMRNEPLSVVAGVSPLIVGWNEGLLLMNYGSKFRLEIPAELGYGSEDHGPIPANSVLIFDMEILEKK